MRCWRCSARSLAATGRSICRPTRSRPPRTSHVLKENARIENFQAHMHLRGKGCRWKRSLPTAGAQMLS